MVAFFLQQLLFSTNSKMVYEKRDEAVNKATSIVSQILVQNVKTNGRSNISPNQMRGL